MNGRTNVVNNNSDSLGGIIPLEAPINFVVVADNAKCLLTWTDPKDKYADELGEITDEGDQLVSQFAYTRIVRKTTGYPSGPNDGDIVTESSTRNQYQSTAYTDEGLVNNTLYYYAAFTCNTDGVWSGSVTGSGLPKNYDPVLANNSWEQINEVALAGFAASVWEVGDGKPLTFTLIDQFEYGEIEYTTTAIIIGFNHMDLADGSGKAPITFDTKESFYQFSNTIVGSKWDRVFWEDEGLGVYIINEQFNYMPSEIQPYIPIVNCTSERFSTNNYSSYWDESTYQSKIFCFTIKEYNGMDAFGASGLQDSEYPGYGYDSFPYYTTIANRLKLSVENGEFEEYTPFASLYGRQNAYSVDSFHFTKYNKISVGTANNICFGFCIGKTSA